MNHNEMFFDSDRFEEDVYMMKDPFTDAKRCIVLGSHCSVCNAVVCVSQVPTTSDRDVLLNFITHVIVTFSISTAVFITRRGFVSSVGSRKIRSFLKIFAM